MFRAIWFVTSKYLKGSGASLLSINARLSFFGVFIGTGLLVAVLSIFNGFHDQLKDRLFQFDPHIIIENYKGGGRITNYQEEIQKIKAKIGPEIQTIEGMIQSPALMRRNNEVDYVFLRGQEFEQTPKQTFLMPKFFPKLEALADLSKIQNPNIVFIGKEMSLWYGLDVGDTLELIVPKGQFSLKMGVTPNMRSFKVAGIFKTGYYEHDLRVIIMPLIICQSLFDIGTAVQQISIKIKKMNKLNEVRSKLFQMLPNQFNLTTIEDTQRNYFTALNFEKTIMTIIVSLFILAAMIGIVISTMNVIRAKRKDIGVLKALGMSDLSILTIFTLNGFIVGSLGSILGIMFGIFLGNNLELIVNNIENLINIVGHFYMKTLGNGFWETVHLIPKNVYYFDKLPISIKADFLHTIGTVSILLSGIASFIPAWYASRLEPIHIIRGSES